MDKVHLNDLKPFLSADSSEIRELLAYRNSAIRHQSLAEARLKPGSSTIRHLHKKSEEIYYITHGQGRMKLGDKEEFDVRPGDAIGIPPGTLHRIWNTGNDDLRLLCCCAPAYEDDDTVLKP